MINGINSNTDKGNNGYSSFPSRENNSIDDSNWTLDLPWYCEKERGSNDWQREGGEIIE